MSEPPEPGREIEAWLLTLHLPHYTSCFLDGGYRALEDCKDVTEERLLELRVFPTGHRRRILRSLEALGVKRQSGGEEDDKAGVENGRPCRRPVPRPRHIFLDKKRVASCQNRPPRDWSDVEGSHTLPAGVGVGLLAKAHPEGTYVRPPQPTPRDSRNFQTSVSEHSSVPPAASSCSSSSGGSSSESLSIPEMPSDWEISSEDPLMLSAEFLPWPPEVPGSGLADDSGGFCGEMVENSIYDVQPGFKLPLGARPTRSYRLRHRPVPDIPSQTLPPLQDR